MDLPEQLKRDEGLRLKPYSDTVGKLTVGYGRNLDDVGLSKDEAEYLLANDIASVKIAVGKALPWTSQLDPVRLAVLHNMCFMGIEKLLGFRRMLAYLKGGNYDAAATEMLDSLWARQVGARAERLSIQMRMGEWQ